jgi:hypothetical protein
MKRTVLVILMLVMVATPCFAQEVEIDGLFSIEETRWGYCRVLLGIGCGKICLPGINFDCYSMGFYEGTVYSCNDDGSACFDDSSFTYIDSPLVSIVYTVDTLYAEFNVLQPSGFGVHMKFGQWSMGGYGGGAFFGLSIGIMFKIENNWTPPLA